ncbi:MAG: hypothetical protein GPJ54_05900 [Candidatus Heimdallarchaeota archaeon]|nr:hypothetical protein [Candidatus Heimdallarchaeota archaeon]
MKIEREVTDVLQVTISAFILSLILVSDNSGFKNNEIIFIGLIMLVLGTFTHIILVQLEILSLQLSIVFSYLGILSAIITVIGYFQYDMLEASGFWDDIGLTYSIIFNFSVIVLVIVSFFVPQTKRAIAL